jgi:hypothetical protein
MPEPNSIIDGAEDRAAGSPLEGAGMAKDAFDLATKALSGNWAENLVSLGSLAYESKELLADPLAKLSSMGLGWLIEFFGPLRWVFDQLTGNQEQLNLIVETWSGIAGEMTSAADLLHHQYTTDSAEWTGPAVAQYRLYCADQVDLYRAASASAESVATISRLSGTALTVVREIVRGLITDAAGKAISIFCRYPPPATAFAAPEITKAIADTGHKIGQWLDKLKRAFGNAVELLRQSGRMFQHTSWLLKQSRHIADKALRSRVVSDTVDAVGIFAKSAAKKAVREVPEEITEKAVAETAKGAASAAAGMTDDPEPPVDQNQLYDGSGPHRVTGTL